MKQSNGYGKAPHSIWETKQLNINEKTMLLYILDRANRFGKENTEFNLTDNDFVQIGFGKDKTIIRKSRITLINLNLINYKEGHTGKGSTYSINWDNIVNLPIEAEIKAVEDVKEEEVVNTPIEIQKPQEEPKNETIEENIPYDSDSISEKVFDFLDEFEVSGNKNEKYGYKCVKYRDMLNSNYSLIKDTAINDITVLLKSEGITDESEVNFVIDVIKNKPSRNININIS